jgi:hypothetical protein
MVPIGPKSTPDKRKEDDGLDMAHAHLHLSQLFFSLLFFRRLPVANLGPD